MRVLLDTHAFLWFQTGDRRLSRGARAAVEAEDAELVVSAAIVWEVHQGQSWAASPLGSRRALHRREDLPGHRHAPSSEHAGGVEQIWMKQHRAPSSKRRSAASCGRTPSIRHRREQRQQPRSRHAGLPLRAVGARRRRREVAAEGRRLRKHERAVFAALGARASRTRRSHDRRRAQVHSSCGVERARQRLCAGRDRRLHRRRSHQWLRRGEAAVVSQPRRRESRSAARGARSRDHAHGEHARRRADGFRRQDFADRLQGRRAEPVARQLLRLDRV